MNKKNTGLFHKGAYLHSIKRLVIPAIIVAVLLLLTDILVLVSSEFTGFFKYRQEWRSYSIQMATAPLTAVFLGISPMLLLYLFGHQYKREGSDVYYSLPVKAESRLFSGALAVLSVDAVLLYGIGAFAELMVLILPQARIDPADNNFFLVIGNYFAATVFTTAVMMIALSLSGKIISTLLMYLTVFIVPRAVVFVGGAMALYSSDTIPEGLKGTIFDDRLNTAENLITGSFFWGQYEAVKSVKSLIFTLVIGIIYAVIGLILYRKRVSETAGKAAVSERWQAAFRIAVTCGACLIPLVMILTPVVADNLYIYPETTNIIWGYVICLSVYFLYELITTKNPQNCVRAIPALVLVVLFNLCFFAVVGYGVDMVEKDIPKASAVRSVLITQNDQTHYAFHGEDDYYYKRMSEYEIKDKEVINLLCEAMQEGIERYADTGYAGVDTYMVHFNGGTMFKDRRIYLGKDEKSSMYELLGKDPAYRDIFLKPVPLDEIEEINVVSHDTDKLSYGSREELYAGYCDRLKEFEDMDFAAFVESRCYIRQQGDILISIKLKDGSKLIIPMEGM